MKFGAVAGVLHFIHELIDQINSAAMVGIDILTLKRIRDSTRIKTFPWVTNDNEQSLGLVIDYIAFDDFGCITLGSMHNGIGECFSERKFDRIFLPGYNLHISHHLHYALDDRINGVTVCRQSNSQL